MIFVEKDIIDLGVVKKGTKQIVDFKLNNNSNKDIKIISYDKSCGCTDLHSPKIIASNSSEILSVTFATKKIGAFEHKAKLYFDNGSDKVLKIKGIVRPWIIIKPKTLTMEIEDANAFNPIRTCTLSLYDKDDDMPKIKNVISTNKYASISLNNKRDNSILVNYHLMTLEQRETGGLLRDYIKVTFENNRFLPLFIPIKITIDPILNIKPQSVFMGFCDYLDEKSAKFICSKDIRAGTFSKMKIHSLDEDEWNCKLVNKKKDNLCFNLSYKNITKEGGLKNCRVQLSFSNNVSVYFTASVMARKDKDY